MVVTEYSIIRFRAIGYMYVGFYLKKIVFPRIRLHVCMIQIELLGVTGDIVYYFRGAQGENYAAKESDCFTWEENVYCMEYETNKGLTRSWCITRLDT